LALVSNRSHTDTVPLSITRNLQSDSVVHLGKPAGSAPANPLVVGRRPEVENGSVRGTWIEAGFGEIFRERPAAIYGRHGAGWQEPSCGYLKVKLSF
jgi:hypothetical protein